MSHATVYVSSLSGLDIAKQSVEGLVSGSAYIRRELFSRLTMRISPSLKFIADDSIAYGAEINKKLDALLSDNS